MSSTTTAAAAARTRRPPPGKGRFDPSEPLHMTTRHAARHGRVNGTPSSNGSVDYADNDSQQDLVVDDDDINGLAAERFDEPRSSRERRVSATSINDASAANLSFETQPSTENMFEPGQVSQFFPDYQSTSPSRKRKRSSPSPAASINGAQDSLLKSVADMMESDPCDYVEVVPPEDLSDRDIDGSVESDEPDGPFGVDYSAVAQSLEITPAITPLGSQAVSPVSEESNPDVLFPTEQTNAVQSQGVQPDEQDENENDNDNENDDVDDAEDLMEVDDAEDADDLEDGDDHGIHPGPRRRLAGRRRAEHHDPKIEATMRRQLQLKSTFRAIARALKPVLAEIAYKTVESLEENPILHEQVVEFQGTTEEQGIQQLLDNALARRKAQLEAQFRWNKMNLSRTLASEDAVCRSRCEVQIEDFRGLQLDRLEHELLTVARSAQLSSGGAGHETEDEGEDVLPRPHRVGYRFVRTGALDSKYDSRSRLALESAKAVHDLQIRFDMFKMLKEVHEDDRPEGMQTFTVMESTARDAADIRRMTRENVMKTNLLAEAAAEAERIEKVSMTVVPNEEATGLQVLGDIAGQSSRAVVMPATPQQPNIASLLRATPPPPMPPPSMSGPNHHAVALEGPRSLLQASPQFIEFQERPAMTLAPPLRTSSSREDDLPQSPRKDPKMLSQSPRREVSVLPASYHSGRGHTLPPILQPRDGESHLRYEQLLPPPPLLPDHHRHQSRASFDRDHRHQDMFGRDMARPETMKPPAITAPAKDEPAWDQYHRSLNVERSPRQSSNLHRSMYVHDFSRGGPLRIERVDTMRPPPKSEPLRASTNNDNSMIDPALTGRPNYDVQSSFTRFSPSVEPAHIRQPRQESRGPIEQPSPDLDPALQAPRQDPRHQTTHDKVTIEPTLGRSLLQEPYHPRTALNASPPRRPMQTGHLQPWELPSSPGNSREVGQRSPLALPRDNVLEELSKRPRSRTSSIISQSTTTEASPEVGVSGHPARRRSNQSGAKQMFGMKANKAERKGSTRKIWKNGRPGPTRKSQNTKGSEGGPSVYRFRLNSIESTPSASWSNTSAAATPSRTSHASDGWPAPPSFPQSQPANAQFGHQLPHPPAGSYPYGFPPDFGQGPQNRNSLSAQPWASQGQAGSPLYAVPQSTQPSGPPPPGGGPPPDQWPSPSAFAPSARSSQQTSRNGQQPAGPPALAPAISDGAHPAPLAAGANHLPAFAQQQRNQESNPRRRAQSELPGHSFKHWAPRSTK